LEDSGAQSVVNWASNIVAGPPAESAQMLTFLVSNDNPSIFAAQPAIDATGTLTFTPAPDSNGIAHVTVVLKDDGGTNNGGIDSTAPQSFTITVLPVNDPPVAQSQLVTLNEDTPTPITLVATDIDDDLLSYPATPPSHGSLSGTAPNLTYTPVANYFGPDSFTFVATDGQATSAVATVSITVISVNDPPVANASATATNVISPNNTNAPVILDGSLSSDIENDPLQFSWYEHGTSNLLSTGVVATNVLPVGTNLIDLVVSDGQDAGTNTIEVVVMTAADAIRQLIAKLLNSGYTKNLQPLLTTLDAAIDSFERGNFTSGLNQLEAFQNKLRAQVAPDDPVLADMLTSMSQLIADAVTSPIGSGGPANHGKPIDFTAIINELNGRVRVHFPGQAGRIYLIRASTNLRSWQSIGTAHHIGNGAFEFEDLGVSPLQRRYYRITVP